MALSRSSDSASCSSPHPTGRYVMALRRSFRVLQVIDAIVELVEACGRHLRLRGHRPARTYVWLRHKCILAPLLIGVLTAAEPRADTVLRRLPGAAPARNTRSPPVSLIWGYATPRAAVAMAWFQQAFWEDPDTEPEAGDARIVAGPVLSGLDRRHARTRGRSKPRRRSRPRAAAAAVAGGAYHGPPRLLRDLRWRRRPSSPVTSSIRVARLVHGQQKGLGQRLDRLGPLLARRLVHTVYLGRNAS